MIRNVTVDRGLGWVRWHQTATKGTGQGQGSWVQRAAHWGSSHSGWGTACPPAEEDECGWPTQATPGVSPTSILGTFLAAGPCWPTVFPWVLEAAEAGADGSLEAPLSGACCPLPGGFWAQPGSSPAPDSSAPASTRPAQLRGFDTSICWAKESCKHKGDSRTSQSVGRAPLGLGAGTTRWAQEDLLQGDGLINVSE